ncbi:MAG: hypothetical protein WDZ35_04785 [Crocinitomicaceae bacterium]
MGTKKEDKRKASGKEVSNLNPAHKGSEINSNYKKKARTKSKGENKNTK